MLKICFTLCTSDLKTSQKLSHFLWSQSKTGNYICGNLSAECFSCLEALKLACVLCSCWSQQRILSIRQNVYQWNLDLLCPPLQCYVNVLTLFFQLSHFQSCIQKLLLTRFQLFKVIFDDLNFVSFVEDGSMRRKLPRLLTVIFRESLSWSGLLGSIIMNCELKFLKIQCHHMLSVHCYSCLMKKTFDSCVSAPFNVNHKTEFNAESETSDRIQCSDNAWWNAASKQQVQVPTWRSLMQSSTLFLSLHMRPAHATN